MRTSILALLMLRLLTPAWAGEDAEKGAWGVERPKSSPQGKELTLRVTLDGAKSHRGVIQYKQVSKVPQGGITVETTYRTHVRVLESLGEGRTKVAGEIEITELALNGESVMEDAQAAIAGAYVTGLVLDGRAVNGGRVVGAEGLHQLGRIFVGLPALLLPYLPKQAVRVGEVWDLPSPYVLWNIGQPMDGRPVGESFQVFEALEDKGGVPCVRLRTTIAVRTELPKGATMLPKGPAVSLVKVEMQHWLGLDGYLRAARTTARMLVTHTESQQTLQWELERSVRAGPAPVPTAPLGKNWAAFVGKLPFVIGYEAGMKEAHFTGRAPMFFVTSNASAAGRTLAEKVFNDETMCKLLSGYTPILIDGETEKAFTESRGQGNLLMDPTLLWEDLDGDTVFTMVGGVPEIPGVDSAEILSTMFDIPATRAPEPRPSEAYQSLLRVRDRLRAAQKDKDHKAVLAAILEIQEVGLGMAIQQEAAAAKKELADK